MIDKKGSTREVISCVCTYSTRSRDIMACCKSEDGTIIRYASLAAITRSRGSATSEHMDSIGALAASVANSNSAMISSNAIHESFLAPYWMVCFDVSNLLTVCSVRQSLSCSTLRMRYCSRYSPSPPMNLNSNEYLMNTWRKTINNGTYVWEIASSLSQSSSRDSSNNKTVSSNTRSRQALCLFS